MNPFYFGSSQKPLFGIHHSPDRATYHECGIVLCHPIGAEYIQAHRAFRQLAIHLARAGFHVLRFDYYGCGDSAGDGNEGRIDQWKNDIATAIDELKMISGVTQVSIIGARLGGSLAALLGFGRHDIKSIVLWEPIVNGKQYINELITTQRQWRLQHHGTKGNLASDEDADNNNDCDEILGFPMSHSLRRDLEEIDLLTTRECFIKQLLLVERDENSAVLAMRETLRSVNVRLEFESTSEAYFWRQQPEGNVLVPVQTLRSITSWMSSHNT
jgi:exosortase A-associated hydrolase 2